jgi:hypothetical protein
MTDIIRTVRLAALAAVLGLGLGAAASRVATPLNAQGATNIPPDGGALGHGHIEPNGVYFCHCSGSSCKPCG